MPDDFDNLPPETQVELGRLFFRMSRDKETRPVVLKATKKVQPEYVLPADVQMAEFREELSSKDAEKELKAAQDAVKARLENQRKGLLDGTLLPGRKFDDAAVKEIEEKIMPKYGLSDYEAAAKIYAADLKPAKPSGAPPVAGANWTFPDIPGLLEDPVKAAREAAHQVIGELHGAA